MRFPTAADEALLGVLGGLPDASQRGETDERTLFARAERHGLGGVLHAAWTRAGVPLEAALEQDLAARAIARELEHEAHLALLRRLDRALTDDGVRAVALKGPLFAARFYAAPHLRGATDVDLLVAPASLDVAKGALRAIGYETKGTARGDAWSLREHHHIALGHPEALDVELHFHAYRGFGERLPSEPLLARSHPAPGGFESLRVLEAPDELVYLAVHAAAHRFGRLAWLHDLRLLLGTMSDEDVGLAVSRARSWGYARPLALAGALLRDHFGVDKERARRLGELDPVRAPLVRAVMGEPSSPVLRSATRFAYTTMLAGSLGASVRYARSSSVDYARRLLHIER